jgi:hypothetical protein
MLNVNVVSGGGGGGAGDASATNQLTQIQIAQDSNTAIYSQLEVQTDRLLFDLDVIANRLHDIEGNVTVTNQITGYATSQLQESSNIAQWTKLNLIEQSGEISATYLQAIDTHLTPLQQGVASYTLDAKTTLAPDTLPAYNIPPSAIPASEGWYYKNTSAGNASQLYYYANQSSQTRNHDYTISAIQSQWAVVRILNLNSGTSLPFLVVYSQPQGSGDIIPGFARSSWVYQVATGQELRLGEKVIIYRGVAPDSRIYPELRRVECSLSVTRGPALTSELLAYATLNSDSGAPVNTVEYVVGGAGVSFLGDHVYKVELTAESATVAGGDASAANQVASNTAICTRLDNVNTTISNSNLTLSSRLTTISSNIGQLYYAGSNLLVRDSQVSSEIASLNSTIGQGISVVMDSNPPISGGMRLFGADSNLFVYDAQTHGELLTLNAQIDGVIDDAAGALKVVGDFYQASQPVQFETPQSVNLYSGGAALTYTQTGASQYSLDVNVNNASIPVTGEFWQETQPVSIARLGFTAGDELIVYDDYTFQELQTLNGKVVLCDTGNVVISGTVPISSASALSVTETAPITGFALETTLSDVKTQTDKLTFLDIDADLNNLKVFDTALNQQLSQFSFFTGEDEITDLRVRVMNTSVDIRNPEGQTLAISGYVGLVADQTIGITGSVQAHCFGSTNGTDFHHLKTTATGELVTHSQTRDGAGNSITSTNMTGTEVWRGLDVAVKNAVAITGSVTASANQYGSYGNLANNVASILPGGVTSEIDVSAWSYFVGAYEDYNGATVGTISLEYSFDNTTYYPLFNTQIFPSGTGTPRRANINKQDIPAVNWIRLRNGTTSTLASVTVTLLGGSLS